MPLRDIRYDSIYRAITTGNDTIFHISYTHLPIIVPLTLHVHTGTV